MFNLRASGKLTGNGVDSEMKAEIDWIRRFLQTASPRRLLAGMSERRLCIFTDAALENYDCDGSIGMVAYFVEAGVTSRRFFFSDSVPKEVMKMWQTNTGKIIATLEYHLAVIVPMSPLDL